MTHTPAAIFFDWDGTLADTIPCLFAAHNHVRTTFGLDLWTMEDFYHYMKFSSRELYPRLYEGKAEEAFKILYDFVHDNQIEMLEVKPGAQELLEFVATTNIPSGIVSNKMHHSLLREVEHLGWDKLVSVSLGAGQAARDKPEADPILLAIERADLDIDIKDIWYVGDTITDMLVAKNAGCRAVLITNGEDKQHLIDEFDPYLTLNTCYDLQKELNRCKHALAS